MMDWLRPLLLMFYAPARGMAEARERAPLGPAVLLALGAQFAVALYALWPLGADEVGAPLLAREAFWSAVESVLLMAVAFVPVVIFVANLLERRGSFGLALQQDYASAGAAIFYARAASAIAALLALALARSSGSEAQVIEQMTRTIDEWQRSLPPDAPPLADPLKIAQGFGFALVFFIFIPWLVLAVREVFRFSWARALGATVGAALVMLPVSVAVAPLFSWVLGSPLLLILLFLLMRGYFTEVLRGQRARAAFRQNLEAATLNPADASAHYNLGLIHLQRKELQEARARFERAAEIDPEYVDTHYQLGRIARAEARLPDAIRHFGEVVARDDAHSQHEVWREVGATYLAAGQFADAGDALSRFLESRQSDAEGLYLMGRAAQGLGDMRGAREWMQRCVDAVRTAPAYKYRADKRWLNEAQQFLRTNA